MTGKSSHTSFSKESCPKLGEEVAKEFGLADGFINLNHGSFGGIPREVRDAKRRYEDEVERDPDDWYFRKSFPRYMSSLQAACDFMGTDVNNTFFINNTTEGTNTVLKSLKWGEGESIMMSCLAYPAVKNLGQHLEQHQSARVKLVELFDVMSDADRMVRKVADFLDANPDVKLAVFEAICSPIPVVLPLKRLIGECQSRGIMTYIDAAHAPGQMKLDLVDLQPDFAAGNFHKWCFTPRPSAFLWVSTPHLAKVHPLLTSIYTHGTLHQQFWFRGTSDLSALIAVEDGLRFYEKVGGMAEVPAYNSQLLDKWAPEVASSVGGALLPLSPDMTAPCMRIIKLPPIKGLPVVEESGPKLRDLLHERHKIAVLLIETHGALYIRISAQIYNTEADFRTLCTALPDTIAAIEQEA